MKVKTLELSGKALDWAVALCEGLDLSQDMDAFDTHRMDWPHYSSSWELGGPIIEREFFLISYRPEGFWLSFDKKREAIMGAGETVLVAAMRCYVLGKLGYSVDIPEELI